MSAAAVRRYYKHLTAVVSCKENKIFNGREPKSFVDQLFNFKLDSFAYKKGETANERTPTSSLVILSLPLYWVYYNVNKLSGLTNNIEQLLIAKRVSFFILNWHLSGQCCKHFLGRNLRCSVNGTLQLYIFIYYRGHPLKCIEICNVT